jgi:hypothetical protein
MRRGEEYLRNTLRIEKSVNGLMQDIIVDAESDAATDRRLELPLWFWGASFVSALIITNLLQGPLWLDALLSLVLGFVLCEIYSCRRRRRRALVRAARFKKLISTEVRS